MSISLAFLIQSTRSWVVRLLKFSNSARVRRYLSRDSFFSRSSSATLRSNSATLPASFCSPFEVCSFCPASAKSCSSLFRLFLSFSSSFLCIEFFFLFILLFPPYLIDGRYYHSLAGYFGYHSCHITNYRYIPPVIHPDRGQNSQISRNTKHFITSIDKNIIEPLLPAEVFSH